MRRTLIASIALALAATLAAPASAHQPVFLLPTDTTPNAGPLLVDGTVSFAIRASFTKSGQKQAFRAALKEGDVLEVQYLIIDKKPENALKNTLLPQLVITSPSGKKFTMKFTERTKFLEEYSRTMYLYLGRYTAPAQAGIYQFVATSRARAAITIGVGYQELPQSGYTMAKVKENNSANSCWSVINGNVYNLTQWINSHPGGPSVIRGLCGVDGTSSFNGKHRGQGNPTSTVASYLLGPLAK